MLFRSFGFFHLSPGLCQCFRRDLGGRFEQFHSILSLAGTQLTNGVLVGEKLLLLAGLLLAAVSFEVVVYRLDAFHCCHVYIGGEQLVFVRDPLFDRVGDALVF